ncbi:MAG: phosphoadenylyl-sulfate reductase [Spirochaetaceae bacterium]
MSGPSQMLLPLGELGTGGECVARCAELFGDRLVMSTSFGIQSAVLLHLAVSVVPRIPVIWIDTGYLPDETYSYAQTLTERLGLNLRVYQSSLSPARMEAIHGRLWETGRREDLDVYHRIRKVEPMQRALAELRATAWLSGVRRSQAGTRHDLPEVTLRWGVVKVHPILDWSDEKVSHYLRENQLPRHPLEERGYATVGDRHLSRPLEDGEPNARASRFGGLKEECGLHAGPSGERVIEIGPLRTRP